MSSVYFRWTYDPVTAIEYSTEETGWTKVLDSGYGQGFAWYTTENQRLPKGYLVLRSPYFYKVRLYE